LDATRDAPTDGGGGLGQSTLTAECKLKRLICRARVVKPGRQLAVVAADVFCVTDGTEKHTATALASIAMLSEANAPKVASPAPA